MEVTNTLDPTNNNSNHQNHQSQVVGREIHGGEQSSSATCAIGYESIYDYNYTQWPPTRYHVGSSSADHFGDISGNEAGAEQFFPVPVQVGFPEMDKNSSMSSICCPSETSSLHYHSGT